MQAAQQRGVHPLQAGDGWLLAEFGGTTAPEVARAGPGGAGARTAVLTDPAEQRRVWRTRERALGLASYVAGRPDRLPGWEDAAVPPARLGAYLREFTALLDRFGYETALYGHFGEGCVHCRISFDLATPVGRDAYRAFLTEAADLVVAHGGSLSGEHGDGQARSELLPRMFGPQLIGAFAELKALFDPRNRMNPGRIVDPVPVTRHLKDAVAARRTRCVGAGVCRDPRSGTMCPSYMATRDEQHSTRGRARILHELLEGETITDGARSADVLEALDLCLSCKACKAECPVGVDMAAHKTDVLHAHYRGRLRPRAAYTMGLIGLHAPLAARAPALANALARTSVAKRLAGVAPHREIPAFARRTFRSWWAQRPPQHPGGAPVTLFADTFNDHFHPEVLQATAEALEASGHRVHVPAGRLCCGRPLYDYGMLPAARRALRRLADRLGDGSGPVVVVEPSCLSVFKDELATRLPGEPRAGALSARATTLARVLLDAGHTPPPRRGKALLHGHCHQQATVGLDAEAELLRRTGLDVELLDAGCCGMAGAFGFEAEHAEVSKRIAEHRLLPRLRAAAPGDLVVTDGFSCRTQVDELAGRRVAHLAELA